MENRYLEVVKEKGIINSLELLEQINIFRKQDNRTELDHNDLLKVVRDEFEEEISLGEISQSTYVNSRNREYPMYKMNFGQAKQILMRESKFVRKAVIKYIEKLELELNRPMTIEEMIVAQAQSVIELKQKVNDIEKIVDNSLTIDHGKQLVLQKKIAARVYKRIEDLLKCDETKLISPPKMFKNIHRELKNKFGVPSYKDILIKDFDLALMFIESWFEDKELRG